MTDAPDRIAPGPFGSRSPASLMLDENGMIRDCCATGEKLFGYSLRILLAQHVSNIFPQLRGIELVQDGQVNPWLDDLCRCGHVFLARSGYGGIVPSELSLVSREQAGTRLLRLLVMPTADAHRSHA